MSSVPSTTEAPHPMAHTKNSASVFTKDVVVVGGCGHVGLPLGIALASRGLTTVVFDINAATVDQVNAGNLPFAEPDAAPHLTAALASGHIAASADPAVISDAETIVVVIGTPVDEHLNPAPQAVPNAIAALAPHLRSGQLIVLRSTLYPGVTALVEKLLADLNFDIDVAFCPERIAEGRAMTELFDLPQIVAARAPEVTRRAAEFFRVLTPQIVELSPEEAELAKLFTNTWRYIKFATANQLYMIANDYDLDFDRIRDAMRFEYPRAADIPGAGFAAGPCLFKDTMQLAAFNNNQFTLGHASMMVNEGMPLYVVAKLAERFDLSTMTVGILGMAFKAESDDIRSSLSYKLKRILAFKAQRVLCHDPHVTVDPNLDTLETVLRESDILIIGAPHREYADIETVVPVVDLFNVRRQGVLV